MKMMRFLAVAALTGIGAFTARAQGPLNPSSPPGETMKTLNQVEPRIPIGSAPFMISNAGSYYLTTNLSGTLTIAANNVTLDLMGFQLSNPSGSALSQLGSRTNILVRNGVLASISGNGIDFSTSTPEANGVIEDLRVSGCGLYGLAVRDGFTVRRCHISGATLAGIRVNGNARIQDNTVTRCGTGLQLIGTNALVEGNVVKGNTDNYNLAADNQLNLLLCEIPENLDWPCSVKLAGTLTCSVTGTNGISVNADNVTIDLAGHTLIGPGASSKSGIYQGIAYRNLHVFNGKMTHWQGLFQGGVYVGGHSAVLTDVQASSNFYGIRTDISGTLSHCAVSDNADDGIYAFDGSTLSHCVAYHNGGEGINAGVGCTLAHCAGYNNTVDGIDAGSGSALANCAGSLNTGNGIDAGTGCTLANCTGYLNTSNGIDAGAGSTLADCAAHYNIGNGVQISSDSRVSGCACDSNGIGGDSAGIYVSGNDNRIDGNICTDNDRGIQAIASGNFIVRNTCSGNATNWEIAAGNACLVVQATTTGAFSGNAGGASPGSTDPNANFTY